MKKIVIAMIFIFFMLILIPSVVFATEANLVTNAKAKYDYKLNGTNTSRLIISFNLAENFDFLIENSNIIIDYYMKDNNGKLIPIRSSTTGEIYAKDKTWAGYLNSFDNYPEGEHKYSRGYSNDERYENSIFANTVLSSQITNSTKIDVNWTAETVFAVKVTVIRNDKSGESVIVYSDESKQTVEKIHAPIAPVVEVSPSTGIKLESLAELPASTQLMAEKIEDETIYTEITGILPNATDIVIYKITLESSGVRIQPNGKVKIDIPIPETFDNSSVTVYRIEEDGTTKEYEIEIIETNGISYASFETEHFSTYVLAEEIKDNTPKTGTRRNICAAISILAISVLGIILIKRKMS